MAAQAIFLKSTTFGTNNGALCVFGGRTAAENFNTASAGLSEIPVAGTFNKAKVRLGTAPGSGNTWTITLQKNGSNTAISIPISGTNTEGEDTTNTVSYAAGDTLRWVIVRTNSPASSGIDLSIEWTPDDGVTHLYGGRHNFSILNTEYGAAFYAGPDTSALSNQYSIMGPAGTITGWRIKRPAPGAGRSVLYTILLNGVAQDGTSGTPDTRMTLSGTATSVSATFTLPVTTADNLQVQAIPTGTPASGVSLPVWMFQPTTAGLHCLNANTFSSGDATLKYMAPFGSNLTFAATENDFLYIGKTTLRLTAMIVEIPTYTGSGAGAVVLTLRKGVSSQSDTAITVTVNLPGGGVPGTASVIATVDCLEGDRLSMSCQCTGLVTGAQAIYIAFNAYTFVPVPSIDGSAVFGVNTTVTAPRAIAMGLDGNTNVHNTPGQHKVFGNMRVTGTLTVGGNLIGGSAALDGMGE